jgi:hypothetical protein
MQEFKVLKDYRNRRAQGRGGERDGGMVVESSMGQEQMVELLSSDADALKTYMDGLSGRKRSAIDLGAAA